MSRQQRVRGVQEFLDFTDTVVNCDSEQMKQVYDDWAFGYDQEVAYEEVRYNGARYVSDAVSQLMQENKHARMLDIAAGTGLTSQPLKDDGFDNIDALDGCANMLDKAAVKNIYKTMILQWIDGSRLNIEDDTYDIAYSVSAFFPNQILPNVFPEICRIVKPGGYAVLAFFEEAVDIYEPDVQRLASENKWQIVERKVQPNIWRDQFGVLYVLRIY